MHTSAKRITFFSLTFLFLIYTFFIATSATEYDKGKAHASASSSKGKLLFQDYNCSACHQIYGLGGYMGPDLTNVISAKGKGPDYAKAFLKSGSARMPDFKLSDDEIQSLVDFLTYVDQTGISPVYEYTVNTDGTVNYAGQ